MKILLDNTVNFIEVSKNASWYINQKNFEENAKKMDLKKFQVKSLKSQKN